ncbi:MAG: tetratricopeptide repeat protein, partial [Thermoanaerobaculia bacterium]|nr:tetratricopeptide repeat protein [Thermoanaerobaculia bacterium]
MGGRENSPGGNSPDGVRREVLRRRIGSGALVVFAALGLTAAAWWALRPASDPSVPLPAGIEGLGPAVQRLVEGKATAVEEEPGNPDLWADLGLAHEANGLWEEARSSFAQALILDSDNHDLRYHYAVTTLETGDVEGAARLLEEIPPEAAAFPAAQQRLGLIRLELGDFDGALEAFRRVQDRAPDRAAGFVGAAEALLRSGRPKEARPLLDRALILEPDHAGARYRLGVLQSVLGEEENARRDLLRGAASEVRLLPGPQADRLQRYAVSLPGRIDRAETLRRAGRLEEGMRILREALRDHPGNVTVLNNLARSHLDRGELDEAREVLQRALEAGGGWETRTVLASLELERDRPDRALEEAERAVEAAPQMALPYSLRAQALVALGRYEEAATNMEEVLRREVRDPRAYVALGVLYEGLGRWIEAFRLYHRAAERWPDLVPAQIGLADAASRLGRTEIAEKALSRIRRLAP